MALKDGSRFAAIYKRFRGSKAFALGLCAFVLVWFVTNLVTGFDPGWGGLNLILSAEASIGMAFFMMISDRQDAAQRKHDEYMLRLLEAQHETMRAVHELLKERKAA